MNTPIITSQRIILRPSAPADAEAIFTNWAQDPQVTKYLRWNPHKSIEETQQFVTRMAKTIPDSNTFDWLMTHKDTGEPFGSMGTYFSKAKNMFEIGYCMMQAAWGKGYATEAATAVLDFATTTLGQTRIYACCAIENTASIKVLTKIGFKYTGDATDAAFDGTEYDVHEYIYERKA